MIQTYPLCNFDFQEKNMNYKHFKDKRPTNRDMGQTDKHSESNRSRKEKHQQ